ncbi:DUF6456 domain-containing protein [Sphingomonas sp. Mn802worker]|uniref:DUF6456 domain-containing protein n=1 Tax=Sphingomonas sp. Mn802worker TaxID=629773 RepID=UPI0003998A1F|nr:DUF6456 domain-containing protein [Sphingomonas sp. Mn802worker]
MRELVDRMIDASGRQCAVPPGRRVTGRSVTVNLRESPLAWLAARGLVSARQAEAGERLRCDYESAAITPAVTMRWEARVDGGTGDGLSPGERQVAAKRRFDAAIAAAGRGLSDILWRVICAGEALPAAERDLGWPARSGRLVLGLALDRLADHYRLP